MTAGHAAHDDAIVGAPHSDAVCCSFAASRWPSFMSACVM